MKIIKLGIDKSALAAHKSFICKRCGCVFEANKHEYQATEQLAQLHDGLPGYFCECPNCSSKVYSD